MAREITDYQSNRENKMEHIKQLKAIRDEALTRLQSNTDYKLLTSLDNLIIELEGVTAIAELAEKSVTKEAISKPTSMKHDSRNTQTLDQAFEKLGPNKKPNGSGASVVDLSDEINGGVSLS